MSDRPSHARQMVGSLLVAVAIVVVTIVVVTAKFGPTSAAEREAAEERQEERLKLQEDIEKARQDRLEEERRGRD
jgi:hypothetical protein